jgi:hypothetical protein
LVAPNFLAKYHSKPIRSLDNIEEVMNGIAGTPEFTPPRHDGSAEESEVVWQMIKAIQSALPGLTQIIIRDSTVVKICASEMARSA